MKYRVTEKHPAYKEDLEIINNILILTGTDDWGGIFPETITDWLKEGWIEEIQEAEFTKQDMIDFKCMTGLNSSSDAEILLDAYIKSKK